MPKQKNNIRLEVTFNGAKKSVVVHRIDDDVNGNPRYIVKGSQLGLPQFIEYDTSYKVPNLTRYRKKDMGHYFIFKSYNVEDNILFMLKMVEQYLNKKGKN